MIRPAPRCLTALPVFNEADHVDSVLDKVIEYAHDVLVVNDGSTDGTSEKLLRRTDVEVVTHETNQGYGAALVTAFQYAIDKEYDTLVTIDCDGQHEPQLITNLAARTVSADIVSGSRYLGYSLRDVSLAPADRRRINMTITQELNELLGLNLTDAFCGFKAYRVEALRDLRITETGYAMPLELWVQAACLELTIEEVAVPLIYLDEKRSFGGSLDDAETRLTYYREVIARAQARARQMPCGAK
jgi:glycosyltransferase involved in cell wall biosynthesis